MTRAALALALLLLAGSGCREKPEPYQPYRQAWSIETPRNADSTWVRFGTGDRAVVTADTLYLRMTIQGKGVGTWTIVF